MTSREGIAEVAYSLTALTSMLLFILAGDFESAAECHAEVL